MVGLPGIEPGLHAPHACILPLYDSPLEAILQKRILAYSLNIFYPFPSSEIFLLLWHLLR